MAHYHAVVATRKSPEEVFAYLSDFSTTAEWDPGVHEAERLDEGEIGEGSAFRVVADFLGRKEKIEYRIIEFDPPTVVTLRGENATAVSLDRITCEPFGGGARISYHADLTMKGLLKFADPLLALLFARIGDRALAGLRATMCL